MFSESYAQVNTFGDNSETQETDWYFAIRLMASLSGGLIQTAIVKYKPEGGYEVQFIPQDNWIREVVGIEESKANPSRENLFVKYNIIKSAGNEDVINAESVENAKLILGNLWRLKYSEYPYFNPAMNQEKGWAKNPDEKVTWMPSESQIQILKTYGINNLSDFFAGEYLFDFLKDVTNRDWQNRYIQSAGVYH